MAKLKAPVMLVILDGFGMGDQSDTTNAVVQAKPHCFNQLWDMYPHTKLEASGLAVGLPEGQMGNSEVGHLNLGSGRIVYQDLTRITKDVESGEFYNRPVIKELYEVGKKQSLHLIGLLFAVSVIATWAVGFISHVSLVEILIPFCYRFLRRFRAGLRFSCFLLDTGVCTDSYVG